MKGTMFDLVFIGIILLTLSITVFIAYMFLDEFNTQATAQGLNTTAITPAISSLEIFDWGFVIIIGFFFIGAIISAFLIPSHPAFAVIGVLLLIVSVFLASQVSNVFYDIAQVPEINAIASAEYNNMSWVMLNLPFLLGVVGMVMIIVMYSRSHFRGNQL